MHQLVELMHLKSDDSAGLRLCSLPSFFVGSAGGRQNRGNSDRRIGKARLLKTPFGVAPRVLFSNFPFFFGAFADLAKANLSRQPRDDGQDNQVDQDPKDLKKRQTTLE
ncbi:MAG: hypothetical protein LH479_07360 [Polaromonas sp.]|nr:hypothetical protein [Polaromonas sp.]